MIAGLVLCAPLVVLSQASKAPQGEWVSEVVMRSSAKLNGCVVGELDPDSPRNEIASVAADGAVYLTRQNGPGSWPWNSERIAQASGELIGCDVGDADPRHAGEELLVFGALTGSEDAGGKGAAFLLHRTLEEGRVVFEHELVFEDEALIHGGAIGDIDPDRPGAEILLAGFSNRAHLLWFEEGRWRSEIVAQLTGPGKSIAVYANGALIGCADGRIYQVVRNTDGWSRLLFDEWTSGQARIAASGAVVLAARDDGSLAWIPGNGKRRQIYRGYDKLRGAALGELDPFNHGLEAVTAGYDKRLVVLYGSGDQWKPRIVHRDSDRFHHVAIGELDPESPGLEVVACGYSRQLIVAGLAE